MVTVPTPWRMGSNAIVPSTSFNAGVYDVLSFLMQPPTVELVQLTIQSLPSGGGVVLFDGELTDTDNMHSTTSNTSRITAQTPGRYLIWGGVSFAANGAGTRGCWFNINGIIGSGVEVLVQAATAASAQTSIPMRVKTAYLTAGDYIELFAYQSSGAGLNTNVSGQSNCSFGARWLGAT